MTRVEDARLVSGGGRYTDDIEMPGMLHMAVLRSQVASARLVRVDAAAARRVGGVVDVLTGADVGSVPTPPFIGDPGLRGMFLEPLVTADRVRYAGQPVIAVLAEDPYVAEDALDAIAVQYEHLPVAADVASAIAPGAPRVHDELPDNIGGSWRYAVGDADSAFAGADVVVKARCALSRGHGSPLETRGVVARYDRASNELTVWCGTQVPHRLREAIGQVTRLPLHRIRVVTPDIGGAFGLKVRQYPEYFLAALFAIRTGRPVKWVEDRKEHLLATTADREAIHDIELAATREGVLLAIRDRFLYDLGAFTSMGLVGMHLCAMHVLGPYRCRNIDIEGLGVLTHRSPTGPYRGFGRPNGVFAIERALDRLALTLGLDPVEVRRRNLIRADELPWSAGIAPPGFPPMTFDSGDYAAMLEKVHDRIGYAEFRAAQAEGRRQGRYLGIGICTYIEGNVGFPEGVTVRLEPSGRVALFTGATNLGQGASSTWAHLAARELGVSPDQIDVVSGDTGAMPFGIGTFGSRTAVVVGNTTVMASRALAEQIKQAAAVALECRPEDVELADGHAQVRGAPDRRLAFQELWLMVAQFRVPMPPPQLEATQYWMPHGQTWASGCHGVIVEVEPGTARVQIQRYVVADDCGTVLQPKLVAGQTIGAIAQGVGGALYERLVYDGSGQLLAASLTDFTPPTACEVPTVEILPSGHPSPLNPLGAKGAGEGGCLGSYAAIAAAIEDALRPLGVEVDELPLIPDRFLPKLPLPSERAP